MHASRRFTRGSKDPHFKHPSTPVDMRCMSEMWTAGQSAVAATGRFPWRKIGLAVIVLAVAAQFLLILNLKQDVAARDEAITVQAQRLNDLEQAAENLKERADALFTAVSRVVTDVGELRAADANINEWGRAMVVVVKGITDTLNDPSYGSTYLNCDFDSSFSDSFTCFG